METATRTRKPQLGYEPRTYDQIYTARFMASKRHQRSMQRYRGKEAMKKQRAHALDNGWIYSAPFGIEYARRRSFDRFNQMQQARIKKHAYWHTLAEYLRISIAYVRAERLGIVAELAWIAKHGPYYAYQNNMPHLV